MNRLDTIIAIANLSAPVQLAVHRAAALAKASGARLCLQGIVHLPEFSGEIFPMAGPVEAGQRAAMEDARRQIEAMARELPEDLKEVTTDVAWGHPFHKAVMNVAEKHQADLVVLSPRHAGKNRLTHAEWRLVSRCPRPLLIARLESWSEPPGIFACVDPAHPDEQPEALDREVIAAARYVSGLFGGNYEIVHAIGEIPSSISIAEPKEEYEAELRDIRRRQIESILPEDDRTSEIRLIDQEPADALFEVAEERDLAVMGALDRSRIAEMLIGSTARDVLAKLGSDVLIVKPPSGRD